jgi:dipeptidyl aminopeptidase/acylaminoacyl peptidase
MAADASPLALDVRSDLALLSSEWSVALAPHAERLAFVSDRDGLPRVWVRDLAQQTELVLDTGSSHIQAVSWSVFGDWLAISAAPGGSPRTQVWVVRPDGTELRQVGAAPDSATVLGPWTHRHGVLSFTIAPGGGDPGGAFMEDVASGQRVEIARGELAHVLDVDRQLKRALVRRGPRGARSVWVIDLETRTEKQLVPRGGVGSTDLARLSPDGRFAYVRSNAGGEMFGLFEISLDETCAPSPPRLVAERAEAELDNIMLTANGQKAYLLWNFVGRSEAQLLDLASGQAEDIHLPLSVAHDASFSRDGRYLAVTLEGPTEPRALWQYELPSSQWRRMSAASSELRPQTHPTLEHLRTEDGLQITGWLYRADPQRFPQPALLLHLHGGPEAQERPAWNPLFQALAAAGISVFAPNIRGSSGFGRSFTTADDRDKRWNAIRDVVACAGFVLEKHWTTPDRLAVGGRSYGGYLTLAMLAFHPQLFAAGVAVCGMSDLHTFYQNTEPFIAEAAYSKYGHPVHDAQLLRELSPIHQFDKLRAPLLVVHGANDSNVPVTESEQAVRRARELGVPVEYWLFEGEGHELAMAGNREKFVDVTVRWLRRTLRV